MKCLSLWQPWASFIAWELKPTETRAWYTSYRGPVAIHAAKIVDAVKDLPGDCEGRREDGYTYGYIGPDLEMQVCAKPGEMLLGGDLRPNIPGQEAGYLTLPLGAIIAVADLVSCIRMPEAKPVDAMDEALGWWEDGRFAWRFENVRRFAVPLPWKGAQGLFEVPDEVLRVSLEEAMRG